MGKNHRQKCQPKIYTESDLRRMTRDALMRVEKNHMKLCIASFALAMHRKLGLSSEQIADVLVATNEYSIDALCFQDVRKELLDEAGLDLDEYVDKFLPAEG